MKIEKYKDKYSNEVKWFYYYKNSKTNKSIRHGLFNPFYYVAIGYYYHNITKGFWLKYKNM